jgi:hypothetical protein
MQGRGHGGQFLRDQAIEGVTVEVDLWIKPLLKDEGEALLQH